MTNVSQEHAMQDRITEGLRHAVDEADALIKGGLKQGDAEAQALRDRLAARLARSREQLQELEEVAMYRARRAARLVDEQVHSHPYAAVGVAAAVGVIAGLLVALSRRR
ncbi:MAG: glycine zipper domain-containing protein [Aquincola tertiaricarbonis]|uniref:glycine zipper domain-containing protein n=1 Tax=Aquincola TaxID=391952 RepID=UPI0018DB5DDE|nr:MULTISPECIES: DUF883 family protein [Aquincola]MCR5868736.1 DUF883 family protein [Aquincola sp. J276]